MGKKSISAVGKQYAEKYWIDLHQKINPFANGVGLAVVIPCINELDAISSLASLSECRPPECQVRVVLVINHSISSKEGVKVQNALTQEEVLKWVSRQDADWLTFDVVTAYDLPKKHAGVGWARKIGMDLVAARFSEIETDGIIVCFDADSSCDANYLEEIYKSFASDDKVNGAAIHYEHPLDGELDAIIYKSIAEYELHLRYFRNIQRFIGLPYAYHTVGSSMAVRVSAYMKQGGMNRRKAGEDFYFLNKIIALGDFIEVTKTKVIPSPRISDRVPFGTGKAVGELVLSEDQLETYNTETFVVLKQIVDLVLKKEIEAAVEIPMHVSFDEFNSRIGEIIRNTASHEMYVKRVFQYLDAFWVMKFAHYYRDRHFANVTVDEAANSFLEMLGDEKGDSTVDLLYKFREYDLFGLPDN